MNNALRKIAFFVGIGLLAISMYWSQDGFNFDLAGDSGYMTVALFIGYFLAFAVTTIQFVFSTNFKELNPTLILFGIFAYVYSIYTNHGGITHFQGNDPNGVGAWALAIIMDAVPEPLIAWSLYESRTGDLIGNLIKAMLSAPERMQSDNRSGSQSHNKPSGQKQSNFNLFGSENKGSGSFQGKKQQKSPGFRLHGVNPDSFKKEDNNDDTKPFLRH
jgi:hypothetical protein